MKNINSSLKSKLDLANKHMERYSTLVAIKSTKFKSYL